MRDPVQHFALAVIYDKDEQITRERDRSQAVREFLVEFLRVPDPSRSKGDSVTVKEALEAASGELRSELRDEPEVRAELLDAIGRVFTNLALYQDAEPLLEEASRRGHDSEPGALE